MSEDISVILSGPVLSFLVYENHKTEYGQEGFLLGDIQETTTTTLTDNEQSKVHVTKTIKINSVVPCPKNRYFYDNGGKVDVKRIENLLGDKMEKLVAWYKSKPINTLKVFLREAIVHKELSELIKPRSDLFTLCLLLSEVDGDCVQHKFQQKFVRFVDPGFEPVPIHVLNLHDKNDSYKMQETPSHTFKQAVKKLKIDTKSKPGLELVKKIQGGIQAYLERVIGKLSKAEADLFELEQKLKELRALKELTETTSAVETTNDSVKSEVK